MCLLDRNNGRAATYLEASGNDHLRLRTAVAALSYLNPLTRRKP
jgi:hypothetical protein